MAGFRLLLFENRRGRRRERVFRDRENPLEEFDNVEMYKNFRFTRRGVQRVIDLLSADIQHNTERNHALSPTQQVFVALDFFASAKILATTSRYMRVSIPTASRAIHRVTDALCSHHIRNRYIRFPSTPAAVAKAQREFMDIAGFPGLVGAVDCTHVGLHGCPWSGMEYIYVNRKSTHSMNIQLICDANYRITNVVSRWPGSTHDARILSRSRIGQSFENGDLDGILIGDSGYPLKTWLMIPIANPTTAAEEAYNSAHVRTRIRIEQVNGQLKNKFRCLIGDGLQFKPEVASDMVLAMCVLFNIAKELQEPNLDAARDQDIPIEVDTGDPAVGAGGRPGAIRRTRIVADFFSG